MLLNNKFYNGDDLITNRREALKNFLNPYDYNMGSIMKDNINNNIVKSISHSNRSNHNKLT